MRKCTVPNCGRNWFSSDLCRTHYRWRQEGRPFDRPIIGQGISYGNCEVPWCERQAKAGGYCRVCDARWKRVGGPLGPIIYPVQGTDSNGYVRYYSGHPENKSGRTRYAHHVVMENYLGRQLMKHENVHHKNGNRADNRLENLELWNTSQPPGQRIEDKVQWAKEIIALYGELVS